MLELHEAHLILKAYKVGATNYARKILEANTEFSVTHPAPYHHSYCVSCGTVHKAFTCSPITLGCTDCYYTSLAGKQQYWAATSTIQFMFAKLNDKARVLFELALMQLYDRQQQTQLLSITQEVL